MKGWEWWSCGATNITGGLDASCRSSKKSNHNPNSDSDPDPDPDTDSLNCDQRGALTHRTSVLRRYWDCVELAAHVCLPSHHYDYLHRGVNLGDLAVGLDQQLAWATDVWKRPVKGGRKGNLNRSEARAHRRR